MKASLLLCAGLLTLIGAMPATATPVFDAAQFVSQAAINPTDYFLDIEGVHDMTGAMKGISKIIVDSDASTPNIDKIGGGILKLGNIIEESADKNTSTDATGKRVIDCEGFAVMSSRMLNNKNPELVKYAAVGWDMTEKKAGAKFATLAKTPSFEGTQDQIIAILIGMIEANRTETVDKNETITVAVGEALAEQKEIWIEITSTSF